MSEKTAHPVGKSYDFWNSKEDSIYDELYKEEVGTKGNQEPIKVNHETAEKSNN